MPISPVLPEGIKFDDLLGRLRELCWGAADILMAYARGFDPPYGFSKILSVQEGHDGPVSAADLAAGHVRVRWERRQGRGVRPAARLVGKKCSHCGAGVTLGLVV